MNSTGEDRIIRVENLESRAQIRELIRTESETTVLAFGDERVTVGYLRARSQQQREASEVEIHKHAEEAARKLDRLRDKKRREDSDRLAAAKAKALEAFEQLCQLAASPEIRAIREEIVAIRQRARTASPDELTQLEQRTRDLVKRYSEIVGTVSQSRP